MIEQITKVLTTSLKEKQRNRLGNTKIEFVTLHLTENNGHHEISKRIYCFAQRIFPH